MAQKARRNYHELRRFTEWSDRPLKRFVILATHRTGSSVTAMELGSHPEIMCHGEVFNWGNKSQPPKLTSRIGQYIHPIRRKSFEIQEKYLKSRHPELFMEELVFRTYRKQVTQIGCKILVVQMQRFFPKLAEYLKAHSETRLIVVKRANAVNQALSYLEAQSSGRWSVTVNQGQPKGQLTQKELNVSDLKRRLFLIETQNQYIDELTSRLTNPRVEVQYEQLLRDPKGYFETLYRFLGVETKVKQKLLLKKQRYWRLEDRYRNYEQAQTALKDTPWFDMFLSSDQELLS